MQLGQENHSAVVLFCFNIIIVMISFSTNIEAGLVIFQKHFLCKRTEQEFFDKIETNRKQGGGGGWGCGGTIVRVFLPLLFLVHNSKTPQQCLHEFVFTDDVM